MPNIARSVETASPTTQRQTCHYQSFPTDNFGILLFSLHSTRRETGLRAALRQRLGSFDPGLVIATTARDLAHPDGPAGPVWALWTGEHGDAATDRTPLAELPERGPRITHDAGIGQPYTEAAFTPFDPKIEDLLYPERTQPTTPNPTEHFGDYLDPAPDDTEIELPLHESD